MNYKIWFSILNKNYRIPILWLADKIRGTNSSRQNYKIEMIHVYSFVPNINPVFKIFAYNALFRTFYWCGL